MSKIWINKIILIVNCFIFFLFSSCYNSRIDWKKYDTKNYSIDFSCEHANVYKTKDGVLCSFPFLPSGLYLYKYSNALPCLDFQKRMEDVGVYPMKNVLALYKKDSQLIVKTDATIKLIDITNPDVVVDGDVSLKLDSAEKIFDSDNVDVEFWGGLVQNALCLQDKKKNRKEHVDYSTPVVDGITRLGLYDRKFYFGETLYSYFVLDLKKDELRYFVDKKEYDNFCKENICGCIEIVEAAYLYDNNSLYPISSIPINSN